MSAIMAPISKGTWFLLGAVAVFIAVGMNLNPVHAEETSNALFQQAVDRLSNSDPMERRKAAAELGHLRDKMAVPHLLKALSDSNPYVRGNVAYSLGKIKSSEAVPELMKIVGNDPAPHVRRIAAAALSRIRDLRAVRVLIGGLDDSDVGVGYACAEALG
ncbi:MAG: HEAT repeat domain-containing protein, partial [bacterium]